MSFPEPEHSWSIKTTGKTSGVRDVILFVDLGTFCDNFPCRFLARTCSATFIPNAYVWLSTTTNNTCSISVIFSYTFCYGAGLITISLSRYWGWIIWHARWNRRRPLWYARHRIQAE